MKLKASFEKQLNIGEKRRIAEWSRRFQLTLAKKPLSKSLVLADEAVQVQLQEVPATSKQITNELMILQEEFHEQLKVATDMFSLVGGSESESDNSDSDSETDDE